MNIQKPNKNRGANMQVTSNLRVKSVDPLISPRQLQRDIKMTEKANETVVNGRKAVENILSGQDKRMLAIVGPCSIHNVAEALTYAQLLKPIAERISDKVVIVMRVYFEKPRTVTGWTGLVNDPNLNDSNDMELGLRLARKLCLNISEIGLPIATEALDAININYLSDFISWTCVGARTVEAPANRHMASGLSMPVGFKNATDGSVTSAINAIVASSRPHSFKGISEDGLVSMITTIGNPTTHIVLRGGEVESNFDKESVSLVRERLTERGFSGRIIVDCSHGNSRKDHRRQGGVFLDVLSQRVKGNTDLVGIMLESYLEEGSQKIVPVGKLKPGVSVTDACIGLEETKKLLLEMHAQL